MALASGPNAIPGTHLILGSIYHARELDTNAVPFVLSIIDLAADKIGLRPSAKLQHCHINLRDTPSELISCHFDRALAFMELALEAGEKCFVHCHAGVSRSASLCIAFLVKHRAMSTDEALAHVRSARQWVGPNHGFMQQLRNFEKSLGRDAHSTEPPGGVSRAPFADAPEALATHILHDALASEGRRAPSDTLSAAIPEAAWYRALLIVFSSLGSMSERDLEWRAALKKYLAQLPEAVQPPLHSALARVRLEVDDVKLDLPHIAAILAEFDGDT